MFIDSDLTVMFYPCGSVLKFKRHGSDMEPTEVVKATSYMHCTLRLKGGGDHDGFAVDQ